MTTGDGHVLLISDTVWNAHRERITEIAPDLAVRVYEGDQPLNDADLVDVTIAFFSSDTWPDRSRGIVLSILKSPRLQWMQTFSAGVDNDFFVQMMQKGVRLSTASGATALPIAQTVVMYMLALSRDLKSWMRAQDAHEWSRHSIEELTGSHLAVLGMGPIGEEVARLGVALGMNVTAIRRTPTGSEPCPAFGFDALDDVVSRSQWIACALPLTNDTRNMFDARRFALMPRGARFINVGRGELVVEDDLIAALQSGHLGGAGLDVFAVEPLPADSPLWDMPNVIVTPHNSGASAQHGARANAIFLDNLERFLNGQPLRNEAQL